MMNSSPASFSVHHSSFIVGQRMFLHERTRKSLCRYGFVVLCLLPTCAVAIWAAVRNTDAHRLRCAAELGRALKLKVVLGGLEYPEPCAIRYTNLIIADPQTDAPILRTDKIDVFRTPAALAIVAAHLTIESGAQKELAELLHERLRDRTQSGALPVRLFIGELLVESRTADVPLQEFRAQIDSTANGRRAHLTFRTAEMAKDAEPVALTIVRASAQTGVRLDTQGAFQDSAAAAGAVVQLLRTLVAGDQVIVPVSQEAEELLRSPAP
jgi:hypothetical protein